MQHRLFGKTGMQVSVLGFGAMRLPVLENKACDLDQAVPLLRRGIDLGINYIDSAYVYIEGTSEVAVGRAIKGYDRKSLYLATKTPIHGDDDAKPAVWRFHLEESLRRFDTPYIDLILFHGLRWDEFEGRVSKPGMALDEARKAQSEGLVRHVGFSSHDTTENVIKLINTGEFAGMLVQYNFLDRHNEPAIARAAEKGMGVAIMGPVAGGRLAMPQSILVGDEKGLAIQAPELALRFVWNNPGVSVALSGMNALAQIEGNTTAADRAMRMDKQDTTDIHRLLTKNQNLADLYCTGCEYCLPCPNEINIPENFRYMNWHRVWGMTEEAKKAYAKLSAEGTWTPWSGKISGRKAEECLQCGECEPKCPQNIAIVKQLEEVARTLKA